MNLSNNSIDNSSLTKKISKDYKNIKSRDNSSMSNQIKSSIS